MSFFDYRWDKCRVLAIGGTYVYLIEGGTNVGGTNVGRTNVGGRKVASSYNLERDIIDSLSRLRVRRWNFMRSK
jgi:hypothetical protein